jgi:hypothetical protein
MQKRNEERKECEEKEKKRKELKGDQYIKGCGSQIFKFRFKSTMRRSWN